VQAAAVQGRAIDHGNASLTGMTDDFRRIGLHGLKGKLEMANPRWKPAIGRGDQAAYDDLMQLRSALAHGNERQLDRLRTQPVPVLDTLGWTRARLTGLNRTARTLDKLVWDHLSATLQTKPW